DITWSVAALVSLIGAQMVAGWVFKVLTLFCAVYLLYLGLRALLARRGSAGNGPLRIERPLMRGLTFGLSIPRAIP
ncbi:MAG: LysE family translocator, partial [Dongiaceae bacterium]